MEKELFDHDLRVEKKQFQQKVLDWYALNKRDLPWRETRDPYKIFVSEIMLQQTQALRVIQKFNEWMEMRPTIFSFAQATRVEVLKEWSGLGFNRRALYLHEASKKIVADAVFASWYNRSEDLWLWKWWEKNKNKQVQSKNWLYQVAFPQISDKMWDKCEEIIEKNMQDYAYLRALPWVGEYTANAILAFCYNFEVPVIDINIKRVLIHTFWLSESIPLFDLQAFALSLVPIWRSREWHNALMDYWSMVLHSKATGIQSAKQSQFKWSDREVRGRILKQLVWNNATKVDATTSIWKLQKKPLSLRVIQEQFPTKDIKKIVTWMEKEWIVVLKGWNLTI